MGSHPMKKAANKPKGHLAKAAAAKTAAKDAVKVAAAKAAQAAAKTKLFTARSAVLAASAKERAVKPKPKAAAGGAAVVAARVAAAADIAKAGAEAAEAEAAEALAEEARDKAPLMFRRSLASEFPEAEAEAGGGPSLNTLRALKALEDEAAKQLQRAERGAEKARKRALEVRALEGHNQKSFTAVGVKKEPEASSSSSSSSSSEVSPAMDLGGNKRMLGALAYMDKKNSTNVLEDYKKKTTQGSGLKSIYYCLFKISYVVQNIDACIATHILKDS
jgi:hypothetical protein